MFLPPKNEKKKNNVPADLGHALRRAIDSTDFKNEILTAKIRRNKAQNHIFLKKDSKRS